MNNVVMEESDRLIWVDCETFGLDPDTDPIIEIGFRITDLDLDTISELSLLIWDEPEYDTLLEDLIEKALKDPTGPEAFVIEMHKKSGLWDAARKSGITIDQANQNLVKWLTHHGVDQAPLCGSSVSFDKEMITHQLPEVAKFFSYRVIDISSLKELCRRYNPRILKMRDEVTNQKKLHRVMSDIDDTIEEFKYYLDEFLLESF